MITRSENHCESTFLTEPQTTSQTPHIRQLPAYQATPIVILSATPKEEKEAYCLHLGATAYVQKVTNFSSYFAAIKALVQHWLN